MCGIAGYLMNCTSYVDMHKIGSDMAETIRHRGPDDAGIWLDESCGIVFSHRRLSIQDLSAAGAQPMISSDHRYVIIFNGEIYNANDIKAELKNKGVNFKGHSDTEVIVEGISKFGLYPLIKLLNGIFALAVWDRFEKKLFLIRDRLGIKPLFWGKFEHGIVFGSELKSFRPIPKMKFEIDEESVASFMMLGYVPTPKSIYKNIQKLEPGLILEVDVKHNIVKKQYATLDQIVKHARIKPFRGSMEEAVDELDQIMRRVVKRQVLADVPVGAFLSGGVDSSSVVSAIKAVGFDDLKTFTIKFTESIYDESPYAKSVSNALGTNHYEQLVTPSDVFELVPKLPDIADEPFADASIIPTYLVSKAAHSSVGVALSGDGGDELFSGYRRYMYAPMIFQRSRLIPKPIREKIARFILSINANKLDSSLFHLLGSKISNIDGLKLYKAANILLASDPDEVFFRQITAFASSPMANGRPSFNGFNLSTESDLNLSFADRMQFIDQNTYLLDNNLAKVDRASMATSLEVRVPLLDNEILDFVWSLPESYKRRGGSGKVVLKRFLERYVDRRLINRPKMGFGLPVDMWLRGPLRDWAENLLNINRLRNDGWLDTEVVHQYWQEHLSGRFNRAQALWHVLMFQAWKDRWES